MTIEVIKVIEVINVLLLVIFIIYKILTFLVKKFLFEFKKSYNIIQTPEGSVLNINIYISSKKFKSEKINNFLEKAICDFVKKRMVYISEC